MIGTRRAVLLGGVPSWVLDGATLDFDFAHGRYFGAPLSRLVCSRASVAMNVDAQGNWHQTPANMPSITNLGLWSWEQRTNSCRNSSIAGAAIGTPGTSPNLWLAAGSGVTFNVVGLGTINGLPYIDYHVVGTTTGTFAQIAFDGVTPGSVAASGQVWNASIFYGLTAGSFANVTAASVNVNELDSTPTSLGNVSAVTAAFPTGPGLTRFSGGALLTASTVASVRLLVAWSWAPGVAIDFTIRIAAPQLELVPAATTAAQGFATPPILTSGSALTRAGDNISVAVPSGMQSVYVVGTPTEPLSGVQNQFFAALSDGTANNTMRLFRNTSGIVIPGMVIGGVNLQFTLTAAPSNIPTKIVGFVLPTLYQANVNGGAPGSIAVSGAFVANKLNIGEIEASNVFKINGSIQRVALSPVSLLNQ